MDINVITTVITSTTTIVSPFLTYLVIKAIEQRHFKKISNNRISAISGKWEGKSYQICENGDQYKLFTSANFTISKKIIRGQIYIVGELNNGTKKDTTFNVKGGFLHDEFLKIDYQSTDKCTVHFGAMILKLHPDAVTITGKFSGYGAYTQDLISGTIKLKKLP